MSNRREFITLLGGAAAWPMAAGAQQPAMPVIGFLNQAAPDTAADRVRAFRRGLNETGYVDGQNMAIEYRWAEDHVDRLPAMADDLVRRRVVVIAAFGVPAALAAKAATKTTSIVVSGGFDPVAIGLAASLNRPGGNVTGVSQLGIELGPKHLELLHELVPTATIVALLINPTNPSSEPQSRVFQAAVRTLGLEAHILRASTVGDFDAVFAELARLRPSGSGYR
jgi:ABC-type uncharacterized transport system substrate-binding protein